MTHLWKLTFKEKSVRRISQMKEVMIVLGHPVYIVVLFYIYICIFIYIYIYNMYYL